LPRWKNCHRGRAGATLEALVKDELRGPVSELVRRLAVELVHEQLNGALAVDERRVGSVSTADDPSNDRNRSRFISLGGARPTEGGMPDVVVRSNGRIHRRPLRQHQKGPSLTQQERADQHAVRVVR
jgi:hypothetical protein